VAAHCIVKEAARAAEVLECCSNKGVNLRKGQPDSQKFHQTAVYFNHAFCCGFRMKDVFGVGDEHGLQRVREMVSGVYYRTIRKVS
jgi:hypothetical protein